MPYWNFEYTKAVIYTVVKVGGGTGQGPAAEVTHCRLNQPPVFSSVLQSSSTVFIISSTMCSFQYSTRTDRRVQCFGLKECQLAFMERHTYGRYMKIHCSTH